MHKLDKINFDSESMFSFKKSQLSNLNNFNYSKLQKNDSNSNMNLMEKNQGKTFSSFKNGIRYNLDIERKSFSGKNINEDFSKKKLYQGQIRKIIIRQILKQIIIIMIIIMKKIL